MRMVAIGEEGDSSEVVVKSDHVNDGENDQ